MSEPVLEDLFGSFAEMLGTLKGLRECAKVEIELGSGAWAKVLPIIDQAVNRAEAIVAAANASLAIKNASAK